VECCARGSPDLSLLLLRMGLGDANDAGASSSTVEPRTGGSSVGSLSGLGVLEGDLKLPISARMVTKRTSHMF